MAGLLDRLIPVTKREAIDHRTVDIVAGYVLGVVTLSVLTVIFARGLTTGIVLLSLLIAIAGVLVVKLTA